jgi:hypothetical protein
VNSSYVKTKHLDCPQNRLHLTFVKKWWRKGVKERSESYKLEDAQDSTNYRYVEAFDGQIVRAFEPQAPDGRKAAAVQTIRNAAWNEMRRATPYGLLYEYYDLPWSTVVTEATSFNAVVEDRNGQRFTRVTIRHPRANLNCVLVFDDKHRLVERQEGV